MHIDIIDRSIVTVRRTPHAPMKNYFQIKKKSHQHSGNKSKQQSAPLGICCFDLIVA